MSISKFTKGLKEDILGTDSVRKFLKQLGSDILGTEPKKPISSADVILNRSAEEHLGINSSGSDFLEIKEGTVDMSFKEQRNQRKHGKNRFKR